MGNTQEVNNKKSEELVDRLFEVVSKDDMAILMDLLYSSQDLYIADCITEKLKNWLQECLGVKGIK